MRRPLRGSRGGGDAFVSRGGVLRGGGGRGRSAIYLAAFILLVVIFAVWSTLALRTQRALRQDFQSDTAASSTSVAECTFALTVSPPNAVRAQSAIVDLDEWLMKRGVRGVNKTLMTQCESFDWYGPQPAAARISRKDAAARVSAIWSNARHDIIWTPRLLFTIGAWLDGTSTVCSHVCVLDADERDVDIVFAAHRRHRRKLLSAAEIVSMHAAFRTRALESCKLKGARIVFKERSPLQWSHAWNSRIDSLVSGIRKSASLLD